MGDVLAPVDLDEMGAEVLGDLLIVVWPIPIRRDAAGPEQNTAQTESDPHQTHPPSKT